MKMTLIEVVQEMNSIELHMQRFEQKYSIKSPEFYRLVHAGKLEENDDFHEWLGLYKIWLKRYRFYLGLLTNLPISLKLVAPVEKEFFKEVCFINEKVPVEV